MKREKTQWKLQNKDSAIKKQKSKSNSNVTLFPVDYRHPGHQPGKQRVQQLKHLSKTQPTVNRDSVKSNKLSKQVLSQRVKIFGQTLFSRRHASSHPAKLIPVKSANSELTEKQYRVANG